MENKLKQIKLSMQEFMQGGFKIKFFLPNVGFEFTGIIENGYGVYYHDEVDGCLIYLNEEKLIISINGNRTEYETPMDFDSAIKIIIKSKLLENIQESDIEDIRLDYYESLKRGY